MPQLLTYAVVNLVVVRHVLWQLEHDGAITTYSLHPERALVWVTPEHRDHVNAELTSEQAAYAAR